MLLKWLLKIEQFNRMQATRMNSVCLGLSFALAHPENTLEVAQFKAARIIANLHREKEASWNSELEKLYRVSYLKDKSYPGRALYMARFTLQFLSIILFQRIAG